MLQAQGVLTSPNLLALICHACLRACSLAGLRAAGLERADAQAELEMKLAELHSMVYLQVGG